MSQSREWKQRILRSGLPLELGVAQILVEEGFAVQGDYRFSVPHGATREERSVDILASAYAPFSDPNRIDVEVSLLVECKYRNPGKDSMWIFALDPNQPDFSPVTLGYTLRVVSEFSPFIVSTHPATEFDRGLYICYKGCETGSSKKAYDTEIRNGICQLQYALPSFLAACIRFQLRANGIDSCPFVFCPVLLTNAPLYVLNPRLTLESFFDIKSILDVAELVPYLMLYSDYGPDFSKHCQDTFRIMPALCGCEYVARLSAAVEHARDVVPYRGKPLRKLIGLSEGDGFELKEYFTQFIVCNYQHFPQLVKQIKKVVTSVQRTQKMIWPEDLADELG